MDILLDILYLAFMMVVGPLVWLILLYIPVFIVDLVRLAARTVSSMKHSDSSSRVIRQIGEGARRDMDQASQEYLRQVAARRR